MGGVGIPYHAKRYVEGRWICICPVCGKQTHAARDRDDREAIRLSPATYAHFETHLPLVSTTGVPMEDE